MYKDPYLDYELYHYGVLGMKWGVRKQKRIAKKFVGNNLKVTENSVKKLTKRKQKLEAEVSKGKFYNKHEVEKVKNQLEMATAYNKFFKKVLNDIETDKVVAGKDYIAKSHLWKSDDVYFRDENYLLVPRET